MSDKYVVEGELLQELYRAYILQEGIDEPFYVPLEEFKPELITPLTEAQKRAGEMEALIDSIADTIHHHLYPAQNEYVRNGRSLAQDIERQIERFTATEGE